MDQNTPREEREHERRAGPRLLTILIIGSVLFWIWLIWWLI
jgi:hypothetical protein